MKKVLFLTSLLFVLTSCGCFEFTAPELRGGENFSVNKIDGNKVQLNAQANMYNDNCFSVKIKPSELDLFVEGENIGTVKLNKKVKLKRRKETAIDADLTATLSEGALMKIMAYAMQPEIEVRLKGRAKGGVFVFSKKMEIDETKKISGASLRPGR